jgi:serine/threonine protein kinase
MAPEQIWGKGDYDHRVDIYAVGVIMYCMLSGRPPFIGGRDAVALAKKHESPKRMTENVPGLIIDDYVEDIVMRAIEKDPKKRYSNIRALKQAILECSAYPSGTGNPVTVADDLMGELLRSISSEQGEAVPEQHAGGMEYYPPEKTPNRLWKFFKGMIYLGIVGAAIAVYSNWDKVKDWASEHYDKASYFVSDNTSQTPEKRVSYLLETRPRGANVYLKTGIGEKALGNTSSGTLSFELGTGEHTIIIRKSGYREKRFVISPGKTRISIGLRRRAARRAPRPRGVRLDDAEDVTSDPSDETE